MLSGKVFISKIKSSEGFFSVFRMEIEPPQRGRDFLSFVSVLLLDLQGSQSSPTDSPQWNQSACEFREIQKNRIRSNWRIQERQTLRSSKFIRDIGSHLNE